MRSRPTVCELRRFAKSSESNCRSACCTYYAIKAARKFNGVVIGFWTLDNPGATRAATCGGHDFALIGKYIVDPWAWHLLGEEPVFKLGSNEAIVLYGDFKTWRLVPFWEKD